MTRVSGKNSSTSRRAGLRADARRNREQLLAAARDVFVEHGADAPLDEVARRAGVGIATLYRRFPDRESLMRGLALDILGRAAHEARPALADEPDNGLAHRHLDLVPAGLRAGADTATTPLGGPAVTLEQLRSLNSDAQPQRQAGLT